jgi:beta-glucosidase
VAARVTRYPVFTNTAPPAGRRRSAIIRWMPSLTRPRLDGLLATDAFVWATGIEDTFITAAHPRTGRTLDEYELCRHYDRWQEDCALIAGLGVRQARYGIPWHRIQPQRDRWDFTWADAPLERLLELGVEPIVDLVHYGLPPWLEGAWTDPRLPEAMAEYAMRVAERFAGRIRWWTPVNEPRITAWYCGRLGWWPPYDHGWRGFVRVMLGVCRGIVMSCHALTAVDRDNVHAHVDATDLYQAGDPSLAGEAAFRQELVFLALDLISGRVEPGHALYGWLLRHGATHADLDWFAERAVRIDLVGINLYPLFTGKTLVRGVGGVRVRMPYAPATIIDRLTALYAERYGRPVWISETASLGPVAKRRRWLDDSLAAVRRTRAAGLPLVGYTWWPLFALVTWGFRQGSLPPERYLRQMGLYDCDAGFARIATPLVDAYRALVAAGAPNAEAAHVP